jgi:hypothetical protein
VVMKNPSSLADVLGSRAATGARRCCRSGRTSIATRP